MSGISYVGGGGLQFASMAKFSAIPNVLDR